MCGYKISETSDGLKIQSAMGMPIQIHRVDQIIDFISSTGQILPESLPVIVSYGNKSEEIFVYVVEIYGAESRLLLKEPVGILQTGEILRGKALLETLTLAYANLVGTAEHEDQQVLKIDNVAVATALNGYLNLTRQYLDPVERYLNTLVSNQLRNSTSNIIRQSELSVKIGECIGIINFVAQSEKKDTGLLLYTTSQENIKS